MRVADLFCGAGGSSTGATAAGMKVVLAVNHWRTAVLSHQANHPETRHICARIDDIDPRHDDLPAFDVLLASPECTHFSIARGGRPVEDQRRATPWHVCVWAEARRPKWIVIENVKEFRDWGPTHHGKPIVSKKGEAFNAWVNALSALGYTVEHRLLNAADYGEATSRNRLFVVARRGAGKIRWPEPTHTGRWRAAAEIIDWARHCPSIFDRKRPLADKTLARIEAGLRKFCGSDFQIDIHNRRRDDTSRAVSAPLPTIVTKPGNSVVRPVRGQMTMPFMAVLRGTGVTANVDDPTPTITAGGQHLGLVTPFLSVFHNGPDGARRNVSLDAPLPTLDTQPRYALAAPFLVDVNHGGDAGGRTHSVDSPLRTITTKRGESLVLPFVTEYYGTGGARSTDDPLSTVTTKHRHGLVMVELLRTMHTLGIADIGFRMLDVDELAAAQGFPAGYELAGSKADQIKQVGNAVCPGVMRALCHAIQMAA